MSGAGCLLTVYYARIALIKQQRDVSHRVVIRINTAELLVDDVIAQQWKVTWQWPVVALHYWVNETTMQSLVFWPDTLSAYERRELKLAVKRCQTGRNADLMAP